MSDLSFPVADASNRDEQQIATLEPATLAARLAGNQPEGARRLQWTELLRAHAQGALASLPTSRRRGCRLGD